MSCDLICSDVRAIGNFPKMPLRTIDIVWDDDDFSEVVLLGMLDEDMTTIRTKMKKKNNLNLRDRWTAKNVANMIMSVNNLIMLYRNRKLKSTQYNCT